uniref:hypothetical protein n=1 Tax=Thalassotalea sp. PLHSN55 TaxID=3435888 RepID=UPI003F8472CA
VIITKFYFKYEYYYEYSLGDLVGFLLLLTPFIAMITWFWEQKLSHQKIESSFGSIFFSKKNVYTNLQAIELYVASSGSSEPGTTSTQSLSIAMKVKGRKSPIGIFTKGSWDSADEIVNEIKNISQVTGVASINTSERFDYIFKGRFHKEFDLP